MIPLIGYSDRLSLRAGDRIEFKVSSQLADPYEAQLVQIICADPNPNGPGLDIRDVDADINNHYASRSQSINPGSCAVIEQSTVLPDSSGVNLSASIFPTYLGGHEQIIMALENIQLLINRQGLLTARLGQHQVSCNVPIKPHTWYSKVELNYDYASGKLSLSQTPKDHRQSAVLSDEAGNSIGQIQLEKTGLMTIAAGVREEKFINHFNGKIEAPTILAGPDCDAVIAHWDFSRQIETTEVVDTGPLKLHGKLLNFPTRAVTGLHWNGDVMCWQQQPEHYAAIHFHDDDIYDFNWESDFAFHTPKDMRSGLYAVRIRGDGYEDYLPFFVCPAKGTRTSELCVLVSSFTYVIYGNHARPDFASDWKKRIDEWNAYPWNPAEHPEYGLSTYNLHTDGSGICHASHRRPLLNLRPGYITFGLSDCSGLRHLQADTHLLAWLHSKGYDYDIITDEELNKEGVNAIAGYKAVTTGTHPEYHTLNTLNALEDYRDQKGHLMYLGGNGFYWRIVEHQQVQGLLEIRRSEGGIRAWASETGEYYSAFDGSYGGLWRRSGRPPQDLVGIGFTAQGQFTAAAYHRKTDEQAPPSASWVFQGIDDNVIGDFGISGGGAAGFELDRVEYRLGSPDSVEILASSANHDDSFILVPEEQLTHITTWAGESVDKLIRADMIYFETPTGGKVFATGSITFCGSLPHNNFENNVSRLLKNVLDEFLK